MFFPSFLFLFIALPCLPPLIDVPSAVVRLTLTQCCRGRPRPRTLNLTGTASENHARWTDELVPPYANLSNHFNPHRPCRAADALDRGLDRGGVQVRHLLLRDVFHLLRRYLADFVLIRRARSLGDTSGALQQNRRGRGLGDESEGAV